MNLDSAKKLAKQKNDALPDGSDVVWIVETCDVDAVNGVTLKKDYCVVGYKKSFLKSRQRD